MVNETRLIYANELWQKTFICDEVAEMRKFIEQASTVDAVEVVRCMDCVYCDHLSEKYPDDVKCSYLHTDYIKPDGFCSFGERKGNGQT